MILINALSERLAVNAIVTVTNNVKMFTLKNTYLILIECEF